jgi:hypothetical protein
MTAPGVLLLISILAIPTLLVFGVVYVRAARAVEKDQHININNGGE